MTDSTTETAEPAARDVLLVCSGPRRPAPGLLAHPAIGRLSVVTEHGHTHDYGPGVPVATVADIDDAEQVRRAALRLFAERGEVEAVLAPYETGLPAGAFVRSQFGLPGPDFGTVNLFTNKYAMKRRLARAGLPHAPFRAAYDAEQARQAANASGWPCVVKPFFGGGSKGVALLREPADLERYLSTDRALERGTGLLLEEYVPMTAELHVDGVVEDGEVVFAAASRYFGSQLDLVGELIGSYLLPEDSPEHDALLALHREVVRVLGLEAGTTHLEVFRTDAGLLVSEIACRPAGGGIPEMIRLHHGVDLWDACVRTSLGEPAGLPARQPHPAPGGGCAVNLLLPIRPGRVTELTTRDELAALDGVLSVRMLHRTGDVIPDELYSASATGFVQALVPSEADVAGLVETVREHFVCRTETPSGRPSDTGATAAAPAASAPGTDSAAPASPASAGGAR